MEELLWLNTNGLGRVASLPLRERARSDVKVVDRRRVGDRRVLMLFITSVRVCSMVAAVEAGGVDSERWRSVSEGGGLTRAGEVTLITGILTLEDAEEVNGGVCVSFDFTDGSTISVVHLT